MNISRVKLGIKILAFSYSIIIIDILPSCLCHLEDTRNTIKGNTKHESLLNGEFGRPQKLTVDLCPLAKFFNGPGKCVLHIVSDLKFITELELDSELNQYVEYRINNKI